MWNQFFLENVHFAIELIAGLVMLAVFWLYLDVWLSRKTRIEGFKTLGFLGLAISFLIHSLFIESSILPASLISAGTNELIYFVSRIIGSILLIVGLMLEPVQKEPQVSGLADHLSYQKKLSLIPFASFSLINFFTVLDPFLLAVITYLYFRRAIAGLERHLRLVGIGFLFVTLSSLLHLSKLFFSSSNPGVYSLVSAFGPVWLAEHLSLLIGSILIGVWVFSYLWKRLVAQLFIIAELTILVLFLIITITFTSLILSNLELLSQKQLENNAKVINLALESKKSELLSYAKLVAQNPQIQQAVEAKNSKDLDNLLDSFFLLKKQTSLVLVASQGAVIARAEDKGRVGNSLSDDPQIKRALSGEDSFSIITAQNPVVPQLSLQAATPIKSGSKTLGVVLTSFLMDNAFVDSLKGNSNLEVSIYSSNLLSATTLTTTNNTSRPLGIKEEHQQVKALVLDKGQPLTGSLDILNTGFIASFLPLMDVNNQVVGMLFVGQGQIGVLQTAAKSVELTFVASLLLLLISIIPIWLVASYLARQFKK